MIENQARPEAARRGHQTYHRQTSRSAMILLSAVAASLYAYGAASAQSVREDFYVTNGTVNAAVLSGGTLYIGGAFTQVGPATGGGVPIDATSGTPVSGFPKVLGSVAAVAPDGSGGWYIGGSFTSVGGAPRSNVAHILADFTVSAWNPNADGAVSALAVRGTTVDSGGEFSGGAGQPRSRAAALDAVTGLATAWNPTATGSSNAYVSALAVSGTTVYAGGAFTSIGGQPRTYMAALDAT